MIKPTFLAATMIAGWCLSGPAMAGDIAGAGSGSNGGVVSGSTNESKSMMQTGVDSGGQPNNTGASKVPSNALPDNAVMNAPREATPGSAGKSQPTNLNGQAQ